MCQLASEEFAAFWTKAQPMIGGYISSMVYDYHASQDILQKTAVVLIRRFDDYDRSLPFLPWGLGVARMKILEYRRKCAGEKCVFSDDLLKICGERFEDVVKDHDGINRALEGCLKILTDRGRRVLRMRYEQDMKSHEIAGSLGVTDSSVRVMLHRVRATMRECIENHIRPSLRGGGS